MWVRSDSVLRKKIQIQNIRYLKDNILKEREYKI